MATDTIPAEKISQLIELYEEAPSLWDLNHSHYNDRDRRNEALQTIATKLSVEGTYAYAGRPPITL